MRESLPITEEVLVYGAKDSNPPTFCPIKYWFTIPHFAQIAADMYKRPIAVYTNNITKKPNSDNFVLELLIYVPFQGPLLTNKEPVPIIMQLVNNDHWASIKPKGRIIQIDWPIIDALCIKAYVSMGHQTNLRKYLSWRYLSIKKRYNEKAMHNDEPVVLD